MKKSPYPGFGKYDKRLKELLQIPEPMRTYDEQKEIQMLADVCRIMMQYRWPLKSLQY